MIPNWLELEKVVLNRSANMRKGETFDHLCRLANDHSDFRVRITLTWAFQKRYEERPTKAVMKNLRDIDERVIKTAIGRACPDANVTSITAEYGTYPIEQVLNAVIQDNWLHVHGDPRSESGQVMKAEMRKRFYPDEDDWKELVYLRARQIMQRAVARLASA